MPSLKERREFARTKFKYSGNFPCEPFEKHTVSDLLVQLTGKNTFKTKQRELMLQDDRCRGGPYATEFTHLHERLAQMVERSLSMRDAPGSISGLSTLCMLKILRSFLEDLYSHFFSRSDDSLLIIIVFIIDIQYVIEKIGTE